MIFHPKRVRLFEKTCTCFDGKILVFLGALILSFLRAPTHEWAYCMELKFLGLTKTDRLMEEPCGTYLSLYRLK